MSVAAFYFRMFGCACFSDSDLFVWRISARNKFYDAQGEVPGTEKNQLCPSDCRRPNPLCACCDNLPSSGWVSPSSTETGWFMSIHFILFWSGNSTDSGYKLKAQRGQRLRFLHVLHESAQVSWHLIERGCENLEAHTSIGRWVSLHVCFSQAQMHLGWFWWSFDEKLLHFDLPLDRRAVWEGFCEIWTSWTSPLC